MKKIIKVIKKVCIAIFILYALNVALGATGVIVPINVFSIGIVSFLNIPGLLALIIIKFII